MKQEYVNEKLQYITAHHPSYESLNNKIVDQTYEFVWGLQNADGGISNVRAAKTGGDLKTREADIIRQWIISLVSDGYAGYGKFMLTAWLTKYKVGDYTIPHDHRPATFSFVYFVKTPKGSSPLIFTNSGKRIKAEEGKIVIFPGRLLHHVPKNKCEGRMTLAGNGFFADNDAF